MYLALTYDHRLLDGREAVTFLVKVCHLAPPLFEMPTNSIPGQGVHRGPAAHAARVNDAVVTLLAVFCLLCLEQPFGTLCRLSVSNITAILLQAVWHLRDP